MRYAVVIEFENGSYSAYVPDSPWLNMRKRPDAAPH